MHEVLTFFVVDDVAYFSFWSAELSRSIIIMPEPPFIF